MRLDLAEVVPVQYVMDLNGASNPKLWRCDDGGLYVIKRPTAEGSRGLASETLSNLLAQKLRLPVPRCAVARTGHDELWFASEFVCDTLTARVVEAPCDEFILRYVRNYLAFARMTIFCEWTSNADYIDAIYWKAGRERRYNVAFVDFGECFNGSSWSFEGTRGFLEHPLVLSAIPRAEFERFVDDIENLTVDDLASCAELIPLRWYGYDIESLSRLVAALDERRSRLRTIMSRLLWRGGAFARRLIGYKPSVHR